MTIRLEPFQRGDFQRLISWIPSEEFMVQWCGPYFTFPLNETQLEEYLETAMQQPPPRLIYKAVESESGEVAGHIELNNIDRRNLAGTVSKVLVGPETLRGKGVGTAMVSALLEIAFDQQRLHRVELKVFDWNAPAIHSYQKLGFSIEGHLRDYRKVKESYWSSYLMSILEPEWRGRKKGQGPHDQTTQT